MGGGWTKGLKKLSAVDTRWQRKISFLQRRVTGYINHIPRQTPYTGVVSQHKKEYKVVCVFVLFVLFCLILDFYWSFACLFQFCFSVCLFLFFERQNIILGGQGSRKDLGGKLDQVILHENILNKNVLKRERMEWYCSYKVGAVGPPLRSVTSLDSGIS